MADKRAEFSSEMIAAKVGAEALLMNVRLGLGGILVVFCWGGTYLVPPTRITRPLSTTR